MIQKGPRRFLLALLGVLLLLANEGALRFLAWLMVAPALVDPKLPRAVASSVEAPVDEKKMPKIEKFVDDGSTFRQRLYYNLSCPFEWSKYSCAHQGQLVKADESRKLLLEYRQIIMEVVARGLPPNTRLILTGDSLMRQVFVSLGCLLHSFARHLIIEFEVDWLDEWPCHGTANCIPGGVHSGHSTGSIRLPGEAEIHFLPHGGSLRKQESKMYQRMARQLDDLGYITLARRTTLPSQHATPLSQYDVLVTNVGIHGSVEAAQNKTETLAQIGRQLRQMSNGPRLWYVTTPTQHFATVGGQYKRGTAGTCVNRTDVNPREVMERRILTADTVHQVIAYDDLDLGFYQIGGGDCSHYCMPGAPDRVALRLLQALWSSEEEEG